MQEWIKIRKNLIMNYNLLLRQQRDHSDWQVRIRNAWANNELSQEEHHIFDRFYLLPPTVMKDTLDKAEKPGGSIRSIPTGEYDVEYHAGFGNFCVSNGVLYSTVGTDIYSVDLSTLALTAHADINEGKEYFNISWDTFPPQMGSVFSWHNVKNTMKVHNIYPLSDGRFLVFTGGTTVSEQYLVGNQYKTITTDYPAKARILSSDLSTVISSFNISSIKSVSVVPLESYIYFFYVDTQRMTFQGRTYMKPSSSYIKTNFSGEQVSSGRLLPHIDYYEGSRTVDLYENINGRLTNTSPSKVYFNNREEYQEWLANPPDNLYRILSSDLVPSESGAWKPYFIWADFYTYEILVGKYAPKIHSARQLTVSSKLASRGGQFVSFDSKSHLIRIMDTTGEIIRSISFLWCDHFSDPESHFRLDTEYTQIAIDPYNPDYVYVLFDGYYGTRPGRLVGRLNIGSDE